jgi:hypothetical protein
MVYRDSCSGVQYLVPIEPFALTLRHPYLCKACSLETGQLLPGFRKADAFKHPEFEKYFVNKGYLLLEWRLPPLRRAWFFDVGASTWNQGIGGASQKWVHDQYSLRGIRWSGIYAWEARPVLSSHVWGEIPGHLKPIYHWYNIPADPKPGSDDNPLEMIKGVCKPQDFVVLKLDIDKTLVELKFIAQIQADPLLQELIDEMFFEHHIFIEPLAECCFSTTEEDGLMSDSTKIFLGLRRAGIRIHSWV